VAEESFPVTRFRDVEAIVYLLKVVPWQIRDFTVAGYVQPLKALDREIQTRGAIEAHDHRFLLIGTKPR
jgi:hypothetical protein